MLHIEALGGLQPYVEGLEVMPVDFGPAIRFTRQHNAGLVEDMDDSRIYTFNVAEMAVSVTPHVWWSFRDKLADAAGYPVKRRYEAAELARHRAKQFWPLIAFPALQGVIGPAACRSLAKDFESFRPKARALLATIRPAYRELFADLFTDMSRAVRVASPSGALLFSLA